MSPRLPPLVCPHLPPPRLLFLAVPLMLQSLSSMLLTLISTVFVGRLDDAVALSGVVLASSVYNVTGVSLVIGLSSALDTLCGQVGLGEWGRG